MRPIKKEKPCRSYAGIKWTTNKTNKKYLRKDFKCKCAYCDAHDLFLGGPNAFHVEHFAPKEKFPDLEYEYTNLLYSCPYCNLAKSNKWVGGTPEENIIHDKGFLDPCTDEYHVVFCRNDDGTINYTSQLGKYIYDEMKLYLKRHYILYNLYELKTIIKRLKQLIFKRDAKQMDTSQLNEIMHILNDKFVKYYLAFVEPWDN